MHTQRYKLLNALMGLFLLVVGVLFLFRPGRQLHVMLYLLTIALSVMGLVALASAILQARRSEGSVTEWITAGLDIAGALALALIGPRNLAGMLPILSAAWIIGSGLMKMLIALQSALSGMRFWWITLLVGALFLVMGSLTIANERTRTLMLGVVMGSMFCSAGAMMMVEFFVPGRRREGMGANLLVARAFRPNATLKLIRKLKGSGLEPDRPSDQGAEVLVHLADSRFDILFGHVDIAVGGTVWSFGNYDSSSGKLWGCVSDGLLVVAPKRAYIDYALRIERKVLIGFPLRLTEAERARLVGYLESLVRDSSAFTPVDEDKAPDQTRDSASLMRHYTGCLCYKPRRRRFRTYFAIGTNCVRMVDEAIAATGRARHHVAGVLMPGDYLSMLEHERKKRDGFVAGRRVYALDA